MIRLLKGSMLASLFPILFFISVSTHAKDSLQTIADDPQWQALLHLYQGEPQIQSSFILSNDDFSPLNELIKTLALFNQANSQASCRFIARHFYLSQIKGLSLKPIYCPEFIAFAQQAPADTISVLFASENLSQPSSIMGHTMLAISDDQNTRRHGVSFFTELDSINPAKIIWDNLIQGKSGTFLVQPLQHSINQYLKDEQRNVWLYPLNLNQLQIALIQRHLWELKHPDITYFFSRHNCATLTLDILRVANPELLKHRQTWISPIDVVKASHQQNMLLPPKLMASAKWKVRFLSDFSDPLDNTQRVRQQESETVLAGLLSYHLNNYQMEQGQITATDWQQNQTSLRQRGVSNQSLHLDRAPNPVFTPDDSQWGWSYQNASNAQNNWHTLYWMPASHTLMDDNRQYSAENELKLLALSARFNVDHAQLNYAHLYEAQSLLAQNRFIGGVSGRFGFGFDRFQSQNKWDQLSAYIRAGIGKSYGMHRDVDIFALWHFEDRQSTATNTLVSGPQLGALFRLVGNSKLMASVRHDWRSEDAQIRTYEIKGAIQYGKTWSIDLGWNRHVVKDDVQTQGEVGLHFFY